VKTFQKSCLTSGNPYTLNFLFIITFSLELEHVCFKSELYWPLYGLCDPVLTSMTYVTLYWSMWPRLTSMTSIWPRWPCTDLCLTYVTLYWPLFDLRDPVLTSVWPMWPCTDLCMTLYWPLWPYTDLCIAFLCRTSDDPPSELSSRNLAASSDDMRPIFFCTASKQRIVPRFVSMTTSS
jgi:hypothetical protein